MTIKFAKTGISFILLYTGLLIPTFAQEQIAAENLAQQITEVQAEITGLEEQREQLQNQLEKVEQQLIEIAGKLNEKAALVSELEAQQTK